MGKQTRREMLITGLGLAIGGCVSSPKKSDTNSEKIGQKAQREPSNQSDGGQARLSSPWKEMQTHYDCIVVGSGYGASVVAARLAGQFKELAVFERGKEWVPGEFPESWNELAVNLRSELNAHALIDIAPGTDIDIVCGNGLGGTSLINAAISIRPEMNVFQQSEWPKAIQKAAASGELENYYKKAESVLQPNSLNQKRFAKSQLHQKITVGSSRSHGELKLNIRNEDYSETSANEFGQIQSPCQQCGNCCTGCNFGAKNVLGTNYLAMARNTGAKIFTQVEVVRINKKSDHYELVIMLIPMAGYRVQKTVTAQHVFLGAGSKGSTQILMRSQTDGFQFSSALGTRLSANGDVMGFAYNTDSKTNIIALKKDEVAKKNLSARPGLIISTYADYRKPSLDGSVNSQFLLLDGVVPSSLAPLVAYSFARVAKTRPDLLNPTKSPEKEIRINLDIDQTDGVSEEGALNHSVLYFACGHDSSGGKFIYNSKEDSFDFVWPKVLEEATFKRINGVMKEYAENLGGTFVENPRSTIFGKKIQATHPLGGCPMADSVANGVVNDLGQVFDPKRPGGFHENLYVVDAAIIPRSLSATPLLTITALAERIAENVIKR